MDLEEQARPEYLPMLNTIAIHERNAGISLKAWADMTANPDLRACLELVAARETSHYEVFKRRMEELGYGLEEEEEPGHDDRLQLRGSGMSDVEKVRRLKLRQPVIMVDYKTAVTDEAIDPLTRSLLRWFADEEADSASRLAEAYGGIEAQAG